MSDEMRLFKDALTAVGILLNEDDRFHIFVGGNPTAVDGMIDWVRAVRNRLDDATLEPAP